MLAGGPLFFAAEPLIIAALCRFNGMGERARRRIRCFEGFLMRGHRTRMFVDPDLRNRDRSDKWGARTLLPLIPAGRAPLLVHGSERGTRQRTVAVKVL